MATRGGRSNAGGAIQIAMLASPLILLPVVSAETVPQVQSPPVSSGAAGAGSGKPRSDQRERDTWRLERALGRPSRAPTQVAKSSAIVPTVTPPLASDLLLGDGWGCAKLHDASRYCWKAADRPRKQGEPIVAHHIPWLDDRWLGVGPDRICIEEDEGHRCFRAPEFIDSRGVWLPTTQKGGGQPESWHVAKSANSIDTVPVTHGAWHGCSSSWCWSSDPPATSTKICQAGTIAAPCAVANTKDLADFAKLVAVGSAMTGDLFACIRDIRDTGLRCIGASRDGFFGTSRECPPELLRAWPSSSGPALAPNAKCSRSPVRVGTSSFTGNEAFAGPRGVCLEAHDRRHGPMRFPCFGAIPPASYPMDAIAVGLGDEPNACGVTKQGQVYCWGAGYSLDAARARAVPVRFDMPTQGAVVAWSGKGPFHRKCGIFRSCGRASPPLPACPSKHAGTGIAELLASAERLEGQVVTVRGALVLANISYDWVGVSCGPFKADGMTPDPARGGGDGDFCCLDAEAPIAISDKADQLALEGLMCGGDLSRLCCNVPVLGQSVAATGILSFRSFTRGIGGPNWVLTEPRLCEPSAAPRGN